MLLNIKRSETEFFLERIREEVVIATSGYPPGRTEGKPQEICQDTG
jgi:hypothetical protein